MDFLITMLITAFIVYLLYIVHKRFFDGVPLSTYLFFLCLVCLLWFMVAIIYSDLMNGLDFWSLVNGS